MLPLEELIQDQGFESSHRIMSLLRTETRLRWPWEEVKHCTGTPERHLFTLRL
jgi:hypothetical protein